MKIRILPAARNDLIDAYWFYEQQTNGVGRYFLESIMNDIERLKFLAGSHAIHWGKHRMIASTFPYSIFYLVEANSSNIYAILDDRRDPEWISSRMS